jgi:hypothetical protein
MASPRDPKILHGTLNDLQLFGRELDALKDALPRKIDADPDKVEEGLSRLVLTVIELLRQLMERQALRRIEGGGLTDEQVEKLGLTFMKLEQRMEELKEEFGLAGEDLDLKLGVLGDLR